MNLIERIANLRELEAEATPGECIAIEDDDRSGDFLVIQNKEHWAWKDGSNSIDAQYIATLRNAAPNLLGALDFQPGDAEILADWLYQIEEEYGEDGADPKNQPITKLLRRYQAMAAKMETENK